jgi:hypothetical protein
MKRKVEMVINDDCLECPDAGVGFAEWGSIMHMCHKKRVPITDTTFATCPVWPEVNDDATNPLQEACEDLRTFGRHLNYCGTHRGKNYLCNCGLTDAIAKYEAFE